MNRCIKYWKFVELITRTHPQYHKLKSDLPNKRIIDLGCCFGTELRFLICEGAKTTHVVGVEQYKEFIQLGFELFGDYNHLKSNFLAINFFENDFIEKAFNLISSNNKFDVVIANSVFHLLNDEQCFKLIDIVYKLLARGTISLFFAIMFEY